MDRGEPQDAPMSAWLGSAEDARPTGVRADVGFDPPCRLILARSRAP